MTKASLRIDFLAQRLELPSVEVEQKTSQIFQKLIDVLAEKGFKVIHLFLPHAQNNEIDTWRIISAIRLSFSGVVIAIPYVIPGTRQMTHYQLTSETILQENRWGIPEPVPDQSALILPAAIDVVIVPLLAFDTFGYRVGYGGGFYDRFLSECKPDVVKIGLSFFDPIHRIDDVDEFDVAMDYCITPSIAWHW